MKNHIVIENDNLYILERLKEIDESYFIVYNTLTSKFEVHSSGQIGGTYCFTIPYSTLDERTIDFAKKTRVERRDEIIKEIDRVNEQREKEVYKEAINHIKEVLE